MTRLPAALTRLTVATALGLGCRPASGAGAAGAPGAALTPIGTYHIEMPGESTAGAPAAPWALRLADGGRYAVTRAGQVAVEGRYRLTADTIVFSGEAGPQACPDEVTSPGTYRWRRAGRTLTLTPVADGCDGRRAAFAGRPLTQADADAP
jgi:hypothetical protein